MRSTIAAAIGTLLVAAAPLRAQTMREFHVSRRLGAETALKARVTFAAGTLVLGAGARGTLYRMDLAFDADRFTPLATFDPAGASLVLGARAVGDAGLRVVNQRQLAQRAEVALSPDLPLDLDVTVGAGMGQLDLGGLDVTSAAIHTAASRTTLAVTAPNRGRCTTLDLDAGASTLMTDRLGNLRCGEIRFQGGVGKVTLDLRGEWHDVLRVRARMALGEVHLILPRDAGVEIVLDRTLTSFQPVGFTRQGTTYTSDGFSKTRRTIHIDVSTAVGGLVTEWAER